MGHSVDMKKLCARVGGRWDLAAELQAVKKKKRGDPPGSSDSQSLPIDAPEPEHADRNPEVPSSPIPEVQSLPIEPTVPSTEIDPSSASLAKEVNPKVINLDGSPDVVSVLQHAVGSQPSLTWRHIYHPPLRVSRLEAQVPPFA